MKRIVSLPIKTLLPALLFFFHFSLVAGEGMWLPILLGQLNEKEMRDMGMRITAEDIYSVNQSSLKDAIVLFGGGCTGELVSAEGLLLTNHHCGYGNIQKHSTLEHDYLTEGFWAQSYAEELPNPGLSVTFLVRMEDVSDRVLAILKPGMNETAREDAIQAKSAEIIAEAVKGTHYKGSVKPFYAGNKFYLFVTETFTDVRLAGAPPSNIGKFGGDTDNWMWPRHTGDFSVFRIYAGADNKPADYAVSNVPYKPKKFLSISLKGVNEGDFTMVYGFPGTTQEYLVSDAVQMTAGVKNPVAISLRQQRLDIIGKAMNGDPLTRIQYSAKAAGIANYWKKMIGESRGIERMNGVQKKQEFEQSFTAWVKSSDERTRKYGELLPMMKQAYRDFESYNLAYTYLNEGLLGTEIIRYAWSWSKLVKLCDNPSKTDAEIQSAAAQLTSAMEGFFKNYNAGVDREIFAALMRTCALQADQALLPPVMAEYRLKYGTAFDAWADHLFSKTMFTDKDRLVSLLEHFDRKKAKAVRKDPAYQAAQSIYQYLTDVLAPKVNAFYDRTDSLQRVYMAAQMEMQPGKRFYPDANSTLRVAYGKVEGYNPYDAVNYNWFTTLDGIMEKENPDIYDYMVEPGLKELCRAKDYGRYADRDGTMHVAFIASNHTTGGNSGSPVLDADGNLAGINFDRCWEGTMSDLIYDPAQCRNISLDIRYCLFIIDKFAGAGRLINEMRIVER